MERPIKLYFIVTRFAIVKIHVAGNKQLGSQVVLARTPNQSALHNVNVEQRKKTCENKEEEIHVIYNNNPSAFERHRQAVKDAQQEIEVGNR